MAIANSTPSGSASAFTIKELTGDKRTLTLTQRALPYRPIVFEGEQRAEFTSYAGSPTRTAQVLGAEELDNEFAGFWKDRFIGDVTGQAMADVDGTPILNVVDLVNEVDDIRRKGQLCEVQWAHIVRRGILRKLRQSWHNIHDCEWMLRFEWTGQGDDDVPTVFAKDTDYSGTQGKLAAALAALNNRVATVAAALDPDQAVQVESSIAQIGNTVQNVSDTITQATTTTMPLFDQSRRLAGLLGTVASQADDMTATIDALPAVQQIQPAAAAAGGPIEGATLLAESFNRDLIDTLRDMKYLAIGAQQDILRQVNPDIITVFTAQQDTDLRDVSTTFYGTLEEWRSLMKFNHLDSSKLNRGDTVFVPRLNRSLDQSGGA